MSYRASPLPVAMVLAAAIFLPPLVVEACGPDLSPPTFTNLEMPDASMAAYARGKLGLLEPGYDRVYLFVAYRNLAGKPLSEAEIAAIPGVGGVPSYVTRPAQASAHRPPANPVEAWQAARRKVLGNSAPVRFGWYNETGVVRSFRKDDRFVQFYNCLPDAFQNAVRVLDGRIAQFGPESPYVKQWLAAQDQVFENCSGGVAFAPANQPAVIPVAAPAGDPEVIREDRAYQIASAHFYARDFEAARGEFAAIAGDAASPYRQLARYLAARCLVREGTLDAPEGSVNAPALAQAEQQLEAILADKNFASLHPAAQGLLGFVRIRLYSRRREKQLEDALSSGRPDPEFRQNLIDYLWLLRQNELAVAKPAAAPAGEPKPAPQAEPGDMTDWIRTFRAAGPAADQLALARWRQTGSLPWLVAAIEKARAADPAAEALEAAALRVPRNSPGKVTVTFHRLRLLAAAGQAAEARSGLDRALADPGLSLGPSARNEFLALRMALSTGLDDWLRYARRTVGESQDASSLQPASGQSEKPEPLFDADASQVLSERLPLRDLLRAAQSPALPASLREQIAIAAWTRSILLGDSAIARRATPVLAALAPELRPSLAGYSAAKQRDEKQFAAALLILQFPAMRPFVSAGFTRFIPAFARPATLAQLDPFRDNWWCALGPPDPHAPPQWDYYRMYAQVSPALREIYPEEKIPSPAFLDAGERSAAAAEWAAVQALPAGPSWLGRVALDWAKTHPRDPRLPEALYLVVHSTRYGCVDKDSAEFSRRAFVLLHARYPKSPWTKKTPYWFK